MEACVYRSAEYTKSTQSQPSIIAPVLLPLMSRAKSFAQTAHMGNGIISIRMRYKLYTQHQGTKHSASIAHHCHSCHTIYINVYVCMHTAGWQDQQCGAQCLSKSQSCLFCTHKLGYQYLSVRTKGHRNRFMISIQPQDSATVTAAICNNQQH